MIAWHCCGDACCEDCFCACLVCQLQGTILARLILLLNRVLLLCPSYFNLHRQVRKKYDSDRPGLGPVGQGMNVQTEP